ncbi:hypothetical protein CDQ92_13155 [Sphingopyxis bauzanensis]|uniref:DUF1996 domain-containing protein n=2 Tax=Sphingopyxis bauzanensis TaxID=651663 RepID=A0A246JT11_9SPHN|nr:hypothetical protein CDQ92_13155 [Sphingopyxis bauzanensis]
MPVIAVQPADIPSTATGWLATVSCDENVPGACHKITNPAGEEAKFRTVADYSHVNYDDPIRNWGQPGTAHCHMFFGNTNTNAFSTYASMRTRANANANGTPKRAASTIAGGPYNATGYWFPCIIKPNAFGDGKAYAVKVDEIIVYYVENPATLAAAASRLPRGLRYIFGTNMDDPRDTIFKAKIATANAQPSTSGRYAYNGNGFMGWICYNNAKSAVIPSVTGDYHPGFTTSAGADPWGGACTADMWLQAAFNAPACYDGTNLWSPGGYKHLRPRVTDNVATGSIIEGCPNGWFKLPQLTATLWFKHQGFSDYGTWYASSDAMATMAAQAIDPLDPDMRPGESMHTDWMNGWDDTVLTQWQDFCIGLSGGDMHTCDSSLISTTQALVGGYSGVNAPDLTRSPQVVQTPEFNTTARNLMVQLPANPAGPFTTHAGH